MSAVATATVHIDLEAACGHGSCAELAWKFKRQLDTPNYSRAAAVMPMPESLEDWRQEHRTARKRADRAERLGYRFAEIDRSRFNDDIHEINTSLEERQGRPMSDGYRQRHHHGPLPEYPCDRHRVHTYGILQEETDELLHVHQRRDRVRGMGSGTEGVGIPPAIRLRAYLTLYRCGELSLVSMILGHGDHQDAGIMYLLFQGVVERHAGCGGHLFYNTWASGTEGLRFLKARLGFGPAEVEWRL